MEQNDHIENLNQVQITAKYKEWHKVLRFDVNMSTREFCNTLKEEFDIIDDVKVLRTTRVANVLDLPTIKSQLHNGDIVQIYIAGKLINVESESTLLVVARSKIFPLNVIIF